MEGLTDLLASLNIDFTVQDHPPVYTVAESQIHMPDSFPVKNLLLKEEKGDRLIFVIMQGDKRLDTKKLARELGTKKLQFAKPEILMATLGVMPGSASLFNLAYEGSSSVEVVIDENLTLQAKLGFHPSINTKTIYIKGSDVELYLKSIAKQYQIMSVS